MTKPLRSSRLGVVASLMTCLSACSSGSGEGPGTAVVTSAAQKVTFVSAGGGFGPQAPSGAPCDGSQWTYVITLADHQVDWTGCVITSPGTDASDYAMGTRDRHLDDAAWANVQAALDGVILSNRTACGADKDSWSLTVQGASDSRTFGDDFYACQKQYSAYVTSDSLDHLASVLNSVP